MCSISTVVTNLDRLDKIVVTRLGYLGEYRPGCCDIIISLAIAYINMNLVALRARQPFPPRPFAPLFSFMVSTPTQPNLEPWPAACLQPLDSRP
jgi:hypothetical protein